jgi:hypothetical protein
MKDPTDVTKRIEARPIEGTFREASIRSELMDCESWPMVMSLSCVWVPVHGCQTEATIGLFLHKLYMSVSEAWRLSSAEREAEFARARKRAYGDCGSALKAWQQDNLYLSTQELQRDREEVPPWMPVMVPAAGLRVVPVILSCCSLGCLCQAWQFC